MPDGIPQLDVLAGDRSDTLTAILTPTGMPSIDFDGQGGNDGANVLQHYDGGTSVSLHDSVDGGDTVAVAGTDGDDAATVDTDATTTTVSSPAATVRWD